MRAKPRDRRPQAASRCWPALPGAARPCPCQRLPSSPARPSASNSDGSASSLHAGLRGQGGVRSLVSGGRKPLTGILLDVSSCWRTDFVFIGGETIGVCARACVPGVHICTHMNVCACVCACMCYVCIHPCVRLCVPGVHMCCVYTYMGCVSVCMCTCVCQMCTCIHTRMAISLGRQRACGHTVWTGHLAEPTPAPASSQDHLVPEGLVPTSGHRVGRDWTITVSPK